MLPQFQSLASQVEPSAGPHGLLQCRVEKRKRPGLIESTGRSFARSALLILHMTSVDVRESPLTVIEGARRQ